jgi:Type VI secretion system (T6SS), amidase effector protein 4
MLNLRFNTMKGAYDRYNAFDTDGLYRELGWDDLVGKPEWSNTCAVRMSLALIECGARIDGRVSIKKGVHRGKLVEPGQNRLSEWLVNNYFRPLRFRFNPAQPAGPAELLGKRGITSFMNMPTYAGGHIDLLQGATDLLTCSRSCYFDAAEVRFWEVP